MITQPSSASPPAPASAAPLSLADAQALACRFAVPVDACDIVSLHDALDRVLAADVNAPFDIPAYDNSAMDGYAFDGGASMAAASAEIALTVAGTALAGHPFDGVVAPGACIRIMTGAPMPAGCDTVIPQERVRVAGDVVRFAAHDVARGANCRRPARISRAAHARWPPAASCVRPISACSRRWLREVTVRRRVRVAVFSTGDELREPGQPRADGTLYDSNRAMLVAMLERLHLDALDLGIVRDDPAALERALRDAVAAGADAVITSGGVSVGEADFTRDVMTRLGDVTFASLALRPGRPLACGTLARAADDAGHTLFFGLPGNPVASAVTFYAIVRPALLALAGARDTTAGDVRRIQHAAAEQAAGPHRIPARHRDACGRRPLARRTGRLAAPHR
jgi:molybdopterin molybdotransferase